MIGDELRAVFKQRENTSDEWEYGVDLCWNKEIEILTRNLDDTINYLDNECTADEFSWISEVFDELVEATQSRELIACFYRLVDKYPDECKKYNIVSCLQLAENLLD